MAGGVALNTGRQYFDDPEVLRRMQQERMLRERTAQAQQTAQQGGNPSAEAPPGWGQWLANEVKRGMMPAPSLPPDAPPARDYLDPNDRGYGVRHGGTIPTAVIGGVEALTTGPGRAYRGEMSREQMYDWGPEAAGGMTLGAGAIKVPANSLTAGAARKVKEPKVFPQYADQYPPVPPPATKVDPKSGNVFQGKGESPETKEFMKERARIRKDMEENGYQPYFDPAQRYDVDPANYPTDVNTRTQAVGVKPDTRARHEAISTSPEALKRLDDAYRHGVKIGGGENWYHVGQLEKAFIDELGEVEGRKAFRDKFAGSMAATTGGADPESNFLAAMYANYQRGRGQPAAERGYELPVPIGGRFIGGNMEQANKYVESGAEAFGVGNPKRHDFQFNYLGHRDKATIDEQMSDLIVPDMKMPPTGNYGSYEEPMHILAQQYGKDPRYMQEVTWAGGKAAKDKTYTPHPFIETVNRSIERTSRLTGVPPAEVVRRGIIRSEMPMYAGGVPLPLAMKPDDEEKRRARY